MTVHDKRPSATPSDVRVPAHFPSPAPLVVGLRCSVQFIAACLFAAYRSAVFIALQAWTAPMADER
jgi:hypothetical protein